MTITPLPILLGDTWGALLAFVFLYPVLMSMFWMIGGLVFYFRFRSGKWRAMRVIEDLPRRESAMEEEK